MCLQISKKISTTTKAHTPEKYGIRMAINMKHRQNISVILPSSYFHLQHIKYKCSSRYYLESFCYNIQK